MGERGVSLWVGVVVISAIAVLILIYAFLSRLGERRNTYTIEVLFKDAQGIQQGAEVMLAGVDVGSVDSVSPAAGHEAAVFLRIKRGTIIGDNFRIFIAGGLLISDRVVKILPGEPPFKILKNGDRIRGTETLQVQDMMDKFASVVEDLHKTIVTVQQFISSTNLQQSVADTIANLDLASQNFAMITELLHDMTARNQGAIDETIAEIKGASQSMHGILEEVKTTIKEGISEEDLRKVQESLARAAANIEEMTRTVKEKVTNLVSDEALQENLKATVANLRTASQSAVDVGEQAKSVANEATATLGEIRGTIANSKRSMREFRAGVTTDFQIVRALDEHEFRADASLYFPGGVDTYYRIGAFNVGESNDVIAQFGTQLNPNLGLRFGLYADKLGAGLDYLSPTGYPRVSFDLYRPNDLHGDLRLWHRISKDWSLVFGVDGVTKENSPVLGLAYSPAAYRSVSNKSDRAEKKEH